MPATIPMVQSLVWYFVCSLNNYKSYSNVCTYTVSTSDQCANGDNEALLAPQIFLFAAQFISGIGQPLYSTLGISYMDDNIQKSKTPAFVSKYFTLNNGERMCCCIWKCLTSSRSMVSKFFDAATLMLCLALTPFYNSRITLRCK